MNKELDDILSPWKAECGETVGGVFVPFHTNSVYPVNLGCAETITEVRELSSDYTVKSLIGGP